MAAAALTLSALAAPAVASEKTSTDDPIKLAMNEVTGENTPMFEGVKLEKDRVTVTVGQYGKTKPITIDYSELLADKKTKGVGLLAGGFLGLEVLARLARTLRGLFGPFMQ